MEQYKSYKFSELSSKSKKYAIKMQQKHSFKNKGLTDEQVKNIIKNWDFKYNGTVYTGLN